MKQDNKPFARRIEIYPGGYYRLDEKTVRFDPALPCFPAPAGVPLPNRHHCEKVRHAVIVIRNGDEQKLLGMRQIAEWGEVVGVSHFGGDGVDVMLRADNPTPPDFAVLAEKWRWGPIRIHSDERTGINRRLSYSHMFA